MKGWFRIIIIVSLILMVYLIILIDTNSLKDEVLDAMNGNVAVEDTLGKPLDKYNGLSYWMVTRWENTITRVFVLHNFFDGVMWVNYTRCGYAGDGEIWGGSFNIPSKWTIHKENGKWEIVKIDEHP